MWQELGLPWETVLCSREHRGLGECQESSRREGPPRVCVEHQAEE